MKAIATLLTVGVSLSSAQSGKYFIGGTSQVNYDGATKACAAAGGKLATFHSDATYATASALCKQQCETNDPSNGGCGCWIGLKDDQVEGVWRWTDASAKDYAMTSSGVATAGVYPWHGGEPNNYGGGEDCVHIWKPQGYDLNDISCGATNQWAMCEEFTVAEDPDYFTIGTTTTFSNGQSLCSAQNANLASFHSDAEYALARYACEETCTKLAASNGGCGCWVGFSDQSSEGTWIYTDGSALDYGVSSSGIPTKGVFPWYSGEPNDWGSGEDCAHIWKPQQYMLNDIACANAGYFPLCLGTGVTDPPTPAPTCETEKPNQPQLSITLAGSGVSQFADGLYARILTTSSAAAVQDLEDELQPDAKGGKGGKGGKGSKGAASTVSYTWSEWKPLTGECGALKADMTDYFDDFGNILEDWAGVALYNCGTETFSIDSIGVWDGSSSKSIDYFCSGISGPSKGCGISETTGSVGTCNAEFGEFPFSGIAIDDDQCSAISFLTDSESTDGTDVATPFELSDPGVPACVALGFAAKAPAKMVPFKQHTMQLLDEDNRVDMMTYASHNAVTIGAPVALFLAGAAAYACYRHKHRDEQYKSIV